MGDRLTAGRKTLDLAITVRILVPQFHPDGQRIAVIIPAYNEEKTIGSVVREVKGLGDGYTVIVVDDCSRDFTARNAEQEGATVIDSPSISGSEAPYRRVSNMRWHPGLTRACR